MAIVVTGDRYLEKLVKFVEEKAGQLIDGTLVLKLNPAGLHYVQSRLEALQELENLLSGAPVDYLRAYVSDLGDHRALEQLRRILRHLTSLKVVSVLPPPGSRDPTPLSFLPFGRLRALELRGCDLSTSAAKGLLELRHTLEKIICHNSTDALRHVFASRIVEIKDSPQWNKLSFVSCACNRLVLMDESLQLLPAVETLDLSRNKFAKLDNLRKCSKLKNLDLGFNHLRSISPLSGVSSHIVQIILRNNALTTLRGLEKLKSLEELDISYNIISNFSELEYLGGLPALKNLWLEGNPLCCARWYRAQVFSYFAHSDSLKLDGKEIGTREFWKMQIIIASRQKQPASFGFYSPAKDGTEEDSCINKRRRKVSRLALIESKEEDMYFSSDQETPSCDNEIQSKEEDAMSDDEAEIVDLINRVELMKKERSILWLREFKEWMDHESESVADGGALLHVKENHLKKPMGQKDNGESSKFAPDALQTSGDEASTNIFESENSFGDTSTGSYGGVALPGMGSMNLRHKNKNSYFHKGFDNGMMQEKSSNPDAFSSQRGHVIAGNGRVSQLSTVDSAMESHSSTLYLGSPPHYQEDILHRRHNLVEEILQLSAESFSVASSDSDTSSSEDDIYDSGDSMGEIDVDQSCSENHFYRTVGGCSSSKDKVHGFNHNRGNGRDSIDSHAEEASTPNFRKTDSNCHADLNNGELAHFANQEDDWMARIKNKRKPKRGVISLLRNAVGKKGMLKDSNGDMDSCDSGLEDDQKKQDFGESDFHKLSSQKESDTSAIGNPATAGVDVLSDDFIEKYFNANVADPGTNETCKNYIRCDCILEPETLHRKR
ncbi:hypothetical protein Tsubulata_040736 [Turnera subulata]|uniref:Outer arm dynein light chain 1 protein n=1 Tax=Turnera subulata TaxID=218843 RepID=A0A9Q0JJ05_9ROSI|nr:hypothetical protein Tsubulata_040736 [Turnera subulata]